MAKKPDRDELISLSQAAKLYGFSTNYLRELSIRGRMKARKIGSQWLTTPKDVEEYIKSRKVTGVFKKSIKVTNK